jgi:hypothetical protein
MVDHAHPCQQQHIHVIVLQVYYIFSRKIFLKNKFFYILNKFFGKKKQVIVASDVKIYRVKML